MITRLRIIQVALCVAWLCSVLLAADDEAALRGRAAQAMRQAIQFYSGQVSSHGGYVYRYSADLAKREGEGKTGPDTVWVQPPGTPTVGMALLEAHVRTAEPAAMQAAKAAADCLVRGQLRSGGWTDHIDFGEDLRAKLAYRVEAKVSRKARNWTTFDDDKSQSALRFMIRFDQVTQFKDKAVHEATLFALQSVLKAQFPNGAWSQGYEEFPDPTKFPRRKAAYPESWPRTHPGEDYWRYYTFNDNAIVDTMEMLLLAADVYSEPQYRKAVLRAAEFILDAQLPDPQPAWAQQYDFDMHPVWARKFEPPSVSGGESQNIVRMLFRMYEETEDRRFLDSAERAIRYLEASQLPDGRLARFYELRTNKPLYFTKTYELTDDDSDLPTHYGFQVSSGVADLQMRLRELAQASPEQLAKRREQYQRWKAIEFSRPSRSQVDSVIQALDTRGAWVESGKLSYHGPQDDTRHIISSVTFAKNLDLLSRFVGGKSSTK